MTHFGSGPTLRQSCKYLRDPNIRWQRILDASERNSIIEGLPPFTEEMEKKLLVEFKTITL